MRHADCANAESFAQEHHQFVTQRAAQLGKADVRRKAGLVPLDLKSKSKDKDGMAKEFADAVVKNVCGLHNFHHSIDPHSGKKVSFGLVRMANIDPLFRVALALFAHTGWEEKGVQVHLCVYHAQFPLCIRSAIEYRLDQTLNRRQPEAVFDLPEIRQKIDSINGYPEREGHIFIVLGSPVTEVGRDHDYDWALVEPSSMRSLIQLAGRVRRHRRESYALEKPNIAVFNRNWKSFSFNNSQNNQEPVFLRPGFENKYFLLETHDLRQLVKKENLERIDSRPRILAKPEPDLKPRQFLVDLEHARMKETKKKAARWWTESVQGALLTGILPKLQPFRKDEIKRVDLVLRPNEDGDDYALFLLLKEKNKRGQTTFVLVEDEKNRRVDLPQTSHISVWGATDYIEALTQLAEDLDMPLAQCAERFGTVSLPESTNGWRFHPALGFIKAAG